MLNPQSSMDTERMSTIPATPWSSSNVSVMNLQPEQTAKILAMHRNSQSNAVVYIVVVLLLYATALVVIMVRYLRRERDESRLSYLYHEFLRMELFRRRKKTPSPPHVIVTIAPKSDIDTGHTEAITHV